MQDRPCRTGGLLTLKLEALAIGRKFPLVKESAVALSRIAHEASFEFGLTTITDDLRVRAGP